jgi:hypothetical protein
VNVAIQNRFLFLLAFLSEIRRRALAPIFDKGTLTLQKPRILQMQGVKGEAVVVYANSLTTQQMPYHRLSRRVNNMTVFLVFGISLAVRSKKSSKRSQKRLLLLF